MKYLHKFKLFEDASELDLRDIAMEMDLQDILPDYTDCESEGDDVLRIDFGDSESIWLYQNGSVDGNVSPKAKAFLLKKGFRFG